MKTAARWFDSHCHLYELANGNEVDAVVERARAAGVLGALVVGVDLQSSARAIELATSRPGVWAGAAIHPSETKQWDDSLTDRVQELLEQPRVIAVGETGLDFYWDVSFVDQQRRAFAAHIALAARHDLPLVVHTRDSMDAALEMLAGENAPRRIVFHCWSGDEAQMKRALDLGAYVSFAGNVSFKNAQGLRALARIVPEDRLLVETDSPYLAPVPHRGKRNEPANVPFVGEAVANARGVTAEEIAETTTRNALAFFRIDSTDFFRFDR